MSLLQIVVLLLAPQSAGVWNWDLSNKPLCTQIVKKNCVLLLVVDSTVKNNSGCFNIKIISGAWTWSTIQVQGTIITGVLNASLQSFEVVALEIVDSTGGRCPSFIIHPLSSTIPRPSMPRKRI